MALEKEPVESGSPEGGLWARAKKVDWLKVAILPCIALGGLLFGSGVCNRTPLPDIRVSSLCMEMKAPKRTADPSAELHNPDDDGRGEG